MARKAISKGKRFDIFRRDGFTCQYCGRQPPDIVLEIDHIIPVVEGGDNDEMNLVSACFDCNRGKGKKLLDSPQRPDAELKWLEAQQEVAELRRYQETRRERDEVLTDIAFDLETYFQKISGIHYWEFVDRIDPMVRNHDPENVHKALSITGAKIKGGIIDKYDWEQYTWGILRNMANE